MRKALLIPLPLLVAAGAAAVYAQPAPPSPPPPPPMPRFQTRAVEPKGDRLTARTDGAAEYSYRCGACHLSFGMGSNLLMGQRVAMGETPDKGLLANRDDLTAEYVEAVVRNGKGAMPPLSRIDVTPAELRAIAGYLGKGK